MIYIVIWAKKVSLILWFFIYLFTFFFFSSLIVFLVNNSKIVFKTIRYDFIDNVSNDWENDSKLLFGFSVGQNIRSKYSINFLFRTNPLRLLPLKANRHAIIQNQFTMEHPTRYTIILINCEDELDFVCCYVGLNIRDSLEDWLLLFCEVLAMLGISEDLVPKVLYSVLLFQQVSLLFLLSCWKENCWCIEVAFTEKVLALNYIWSLSL